MAEETHSGAAPPPGQSLAARVRAGLGGLRRWRPGFAIDAKVAATGVAVLLALGPAVTIAGAKLLAARARAEARAYERVATPRLAHRAAVERDRTLLAEAARKPGVGATIEVIARALPPEASLARVERGGDGLLELEVKTPDPDKLRSALRREPALASLHDTDQRQDEAAMLVTLREQPE